MPRPDASPLLVTTRSAVLVQDPSRWYPLILRHSRQERVHGSHFNPVGHSCSLFTAASRLTRDGKPAKIKFVESLGTTGVMLY